MLKNWHGKKVRYKLVEILINQNFLTLILIKDNYNDELNFLCPIQKEENKNICANLPTVGYNESWLGGTGYIDRIEPNW